MRKELSSFLKSFAIYGSSSAINRFATLLLMPFLTRELTPVDYGILAILNITSTLFSGIFSLGTGASMSVCFFEETSRKEQMRLVWSNFLVLLINTAVWLLLIWVLSPRISRLVFTTEAYGNEVLLSFLSLTFTSLAAPFLLLLRLDERATTYARITLGCAISGILIGAYLVLILKMGIVGMLLASTFSSLLTFIFGFLSGKESWFLMPQKKQVMKLIHTGAPSIIGVGAFFLIDWSDRFLIEHFLGLWSLGIYSVGYSFGMVMLIAVDGAFGTAWPAFFSRYANRPIEARRILGRAASYVFMGAGLASLVFFALAKPISWLFLAENFRASYVLVGPVALSYALKACYLATLPPIVLKRKIHIQTGIEWVAATINLALNLLLIPVLGILGAAIATALAYLSLPLVTFLIGRNYLPMDFPGRQLRRFFFIWISTIACILVTYQTHWFASGTFSLIVLALSALSVFRYVLSRNEQDFIREKIHFTR